MVSIRKVLVVSLCFMVCFTGTGFAANSMKTCKKEAVEWLDANQKIFEDAATAIHGFAELALEEYRSSEYLAGMLERDGFIVERGVADMPTAFIATFGSGYPVIGILAEYDALPGLSQKAALPYQEAVEPGAPGHGCGHNLFGVGSTAAAMAIKTVIEKRGITGTVKLFGCPAEETVVGKVYMAKAGVFDGLDVCFNWHPSSRNSIHLGSNNALNNFEVTFHGKTAHAAADPHNGRSALDAVELMNAGANFLREHVKETVRIHYMIKDGGLAPNIVPEYATVWYYVRDINRKGVEHVYERVLKCAEGASLMTETTYEVNLITGVYNYLPNHVVSEVVYRNLKELGPVEFSEEEQAFAKEMQRNIGKEEKGLSAEIAKFEAPKRIGRASTDVSDVSWIVPTSGELGLVTNPLGVPGHSWCVTSSSGSSIGMKGMFHAAKTLATSGIEVLLDTDIVEKAQEEFREKTEGFVYKSALPEGQKPPVPGRK